MNLIIDIGNTRAKAYHVTAQGKVCHSSVLSPSFAELAILAPPCHAAIVSSVAGSGVALPMLPMPVLQLTPDTPLPIPIEYGTRSTLGADRVAAAVGAHRHFPDRPCLVIDSGTCITIDLVLPERGFVGGNISAGITMRLQACHHYTGRLPLVETVEPDTPSHALAKATHQALAYGARLGVRYELEGYVRQFAKKYRNLAVILTGGATFLFDVPEKVPIFVRPNLVAEGLNAILEYNTTNL